MQRSILACFAVSAHGVENPMNKVYALMDECVAKIKADAKAGDKAYEEYYEWCDDASKTAAFDIKTFSSQVGPLSAQIGKLTGDIQVSTTKIDDLIPTISGNEADLKKATEVREKEAADFASAEGELIDGVDTLTRTIGILEREMAKNSAALAQIDTSSFRNLVNALGNIVDAAGMTGSDKSKLTALIQSQDNDDDDDDTRATSAPAAAAYQSQSGGIVDVVTSMKDKAEGELDDLRKAEAQARANFQMLKGALEGKISAQSKDLEDEKKAVATASAEKAQAEGDLAMAEKNLQQAKSDEAQMHSSCLTVAADHEAVVAARSEELAVIAKAKEILQGSTGAAVSKSYSFVQVRSEDARSNVIVKAVKTLAKEERSTKLAQLASRISTIITYGGKGVFDKIKGLIEDMVAKLEKEAQEDATEKAYCDEEMAKTEEKKADLKNDMEAVAAKIDEASSRSAQLKEEATEAQEILAKISKEQAQLDLMRAEENADYKVSKADLQQGIEGVEKALVVLRDYYNNGDSMLQDGESFSSFAQQPAPPQKHSKSSGAGGSIIDILELCENDFTQDLAKEEAAEADSQTIYDKATQENKVARAVKEQDVKYKTQEFKSLDKEITEISRDKATLAEEMDATLDYYKKIQERCVAKPESYEERKARREAEIAGLKRSLMILNDQPAFTQTIKRHGGLRGASQP